MVELIGQILSICGMACIVSSFQMKNKTLLLVIYLSGNVFFSVSYFMLGEYIGGMLNGICGTLALTYMNAEKIKNKKLVNSIFFLLFSTAYVLSFTVFDTPRTAPNFAREVLPLIASYLTTISFSTKNSSTVRKLGLINSPLWLTYNLIVFSIGGIICECISLCSIIVGIIRHDIKHISK